LAVPRPREPAAQARLRADLQGFLEANTRRVVFDEAQRLPELFSALRHFLDRARSKGRYVLTGSAHPALMRSISESLAGRVGILELTPFSNEELAGTRHAPSVGSGAAIRPSTRSSSRGSAAPGWTAT